MSAATRDVGVELQELVALVPEEFWACRLALLLLAERSEGDAARLASYMRTLPATYTVPLFWSSEAIASLKYPTVSKRLLKTAKFVQSFASEHLTGKTKAFNGLSVGADALGWAVAACSSRAFRVGGERVLCPIIDIGNHAPRGVANCEVRGTLGGKIELVALRSISLGEEVTYCYGDLSNDDFLLDYGFLPSDPPNPNDDCVLSWADGQLLSTACSTAGLPEPRAEWQSAALRLCLPRDLQSIKVTKVGLEDAAMAACRVAAASDAAALRKAQGGKRPLPPAGEVRALKIAAAVCALALSGFPEPEVKGAAAPADGKSDGATLSDGGSSLAMRFLEEKRGVCSAALEGLGERIKALQTGEARAELRGAQKGKAASGVRKQSAARKGPARPKASGFGASSSRK